MNKNKIFIWLGILLILTVGLIHAIDAKDSFGDAAYKGWLFCANAAGALVAAYGIFSQKKWGWNLGFLIALGSFVGYVLSRTAGLPYIAAEPDAWFEPLGVASLVAEGFYIVFYFLRKLQK